MIFEHKKTNFVAALVLCLLCISCLLLMSCMLAGCGKTQTQEFRNPDLGCGWESKSTLELKYAQNFSIDYYDGGYKLVCISNEARYLIVPSDAEVPAGLSSDIVVLQQPLENIYMVATDTMCMFDSINELDSIAISSLQAQDWSNENAKAAMEEGKIVYGGKYNSPDYEVIVSKNCKMAIESTMINHVPEVKEKLQDMGIVVLTEQSSQESNPLGRTEWVKLYGAMFNKEDLANQVFEQQVAQVESISTSDTSSPTVAFFYINSNGAPVVRKPGDYITKMISMAGGDYVFKQLDTSESGSSSVTMEMESFYIQARDSDVIIYNSTTTGGISSVSELISKNDVFSEFKAVQNNNVWCSESNMYQMAMSSGDIILEINSILAGDQTRDYKYFTKLQ